MQTPSPNSMAANSNRGVLANAITNNTITTVLFSHDVNGDDKIILGTSSELPEFNCDNAAPEIKLHTVCNLIYTLWISFFSSFKLFLKDQ